MHAVHALNYMIVNLYLPFSIISVNAVINPSNMAVCPPAFRESTILIRNARNKLFSFQYYISKVIIVTTLKTLSYYGSELP